MFFSRGVKQAFSVPRLEKSSSNLAYCFRGLDQTPDKTHNFTTMLLLFLHFILFSLSSAWPQKLVLEKESCLDEGNTYERQQGVALIGSLPNLSQPITLRTVGELPVLPIDGKYIVAQQMFKKVLEGKEKNLGSDDLDTLKTVNDLANISMHHGNYTEAFDLYERVAKGKLAKLGETDPGTLDAFNNLAVVWSVLRKQGVKSDNTYIDTRFSDSSREKKVFLPDLYSNLYSKRKNYLGGGHPDTLKTAVGYADLLSDDMQSSYALGRAEALYNTVLDALTDTQTPEEEIFLLAVIDKLANLSYDLEKFDRAKSLFAGVLSKRGQVLGKVHVDTLSTRNNFANMLLHQGNYSLAEAMYESALKGYEKQYGTNHPETLKVVNNLATYHFRYVEKANKYKQLSIQEAKKGYNRAVEGFEQALGPHHKYYLTALNNQAILIFQEIKIIDGARNAAPGTATEPVINNTNEKAKTPSACEPFL